MVLAASGPAPHSGPGGDAAGAGWLGSERSTAADVVESGPQRVPGTSGLRRRLRNRHRRPKASGSPPTADASQPRPTGSRPKAGDNQAWRRPVVAVAAAVAAAAALAALQAEADPAALQEAQVGPVGPDRVIVDNRARTRSPPYDRLPGRTPIPAPTLVYHESELVQGPLPATGAGPGAEPARDAARMVLGRYCRRPTAYVIQLDGEPGWRAVTALVLRPPPAGPRRLAPLRLRWTGSAYAWRASSVDLAGCAA